MTLNHAKICEGAGPGGGGGHRRKATPGFAHTRRVGVGLDLVVKRNHQRTRLVTLS